MRLEDLAGRIAADTADCQGLVDLGAGNGQFSGPLKVPHRAAVELYRPYVEHIRKIYPDMLVFMADARTWIAERSDASIDAVLAINLIEHMTKEEGERLLVNALRVARRQLIVYTPNGFQAQHPSEVLPEFGPNSLQEHLSGWTRDDLRLFEIELVEIDGNEAGGLYAVYRRST